MESDSQRKMPPASYVNYLQVASRREELHLSFGQLADGEGQNAHLIASLVSTPTHARAMLEVLEQALDKYDKRFGSDSEDGSD